MPGVTSRVGAWLSEIEMSRVTSSRLFFVDGAILATLTDEDLQLQFCKAESAARVGKSERVKRHTRTAAGSPRTRIIVQ